jgi:hypothetical protein
LTKEGTKEEEKWDEKLRCWVKWMELIMIKYKDSIKIIKVRRRVDLSIFIGYEFVILTSLEDKKTFYNFH